MIQKSRAGDRRKEGEDSAKKIRWCEERTEEDTTRVSCGDKRIEQKG